ncbi:Transmembrane 9 superfamily member 1 [Oopsacas minuta]|uniref:Transmembrane 9 superfamily member n=1 Tax=Oopsacas minuta TaxID=111878 RepID=A0AAV7KJM0_9METZ|nr:Transmembrane 9 superfamily member 1 [Oopsacas minuta]
MSVEYIQDQAVTVFVNKVGPYYNPQETYHYYTLPVCAPDKIEHKSMTLGEILDGDRMAFSDYIIKFKEDKAKTKLCTKHIGQKDLDKFKSAVEDLYYFEFVVDDIIFKGFIGHFEEGPILPHQHNLYLWNHLHFIFSYDADTQNHIVSARAIASTEDPVNLNDLTAPTRIDFFYSVTWQAANTRYEDRAKLQLDFFPKAKQIHWMSVINSTILVLLLVVVMVKTLYKNLRQDLTSYNVDRPDEIIEDYGWKLISGDIFRYPQHMMLLCAILGSGSQFILLGLTLLFFESAGVLSQNHHGSVNALTILLYAFMSCLSGFISSACYKKFGGDLWYWNIVLTFAIFFVPFFLIWSMINSVAWMFNSTQALPISTILLLFLLWFIVGLPLTILGGICGKNMMSTFQAPCRTKKFPREIPAQPWYNKSWFYMLVGGFLPFSAISIEIYYIYLTLWGRQYFALYGITLLLFVILLLVAACISITLTYFQLSLEDYHWWWRSMYSVGSLSLFVLSYALYFYYKTSHMHGFLQGLQFFGYTLIAAYILFLMLATVSFISSFALVYYMYSRLKFE